MVDQEKKVSEAMHQYVETKEPPVLAAAAQGWATFAINCFSGTRLRKALAISQALIDFVAIDEKAKQ